METSLHKNIPGIDDASGKNILFETYRFEVIESDISDKAVHKVALHYFTGTITLLDSLGEYLLLAPGDKTKELTGSEIIEDTFLLKLVPGISISSYQDVVSTYKNTQYN